MTSDPHKGIYVRWYSGLIDKRDNPSTAPNTKKTYLSSSVKNLESRIIIAKEMQIPISELDTSSGVERMRMRAPEAGKYMLYASFRNYVELYRYIESVPPLERQFHEATPRSSRQKPRFDIDIKKQDLIEFRVSNPAALENFRAFGEYVKDLVITTSMAVLASLGVEACPALDVMLFESHGERKRSFHIVLNRYYQNGCDQAMAFYSSCLQRCDTELDKAVFTRFVDTGPYSRNANLRLVWSGKRDGSEYRVKKYVNSYTYKGEKVTHVLPNYNHPSMAVRRMSILLHSLVSFTEEAEGLPNLYNTPPIRIVESEDIDEETFQACKRHIENWDTQRAFCVLEAEGSIIRLERLMDTVCDLCKRQHESNPFCYVNSRGLFWHCGRAKGVGGVFISSLEGRTNDTSALLDRVNACRESAGLERLDGTTVHTKPEPQKLIFTVLGEDMTEYALQPEPEVETPALVEVEPEPEVTIQSIVEAPKQRKVVARPRPKAVLDPIPIIAAQPRPVTAVVHSSPISRLRLQSRTPALACDPQRAAPACEVRTSRSACSGSRRKMQLDWDD